MPAADDALRRIDALIGVALRIATAAPSGRVALATVAAAIEPEWLPMPWGEPIWAELEAAREQAAQPISGKEVEKALRQAWDAKPADELDEFEAEPVAVTPTSQVHRAVLDGAPVAVKILRPGLAAGVRQDLALLEGLLAPLGAAFPGIDPSALLRETRERVLDELDLEHEASAMRRFQRALRGHDFLVVPAPVTRLAADGVLVSEWIDGVPLRDAPAAALDTAAAQLVTFVAGGLREGLVHADPNPDDILMTSDGRLAVLDFGAVAIVETERADAGLAVLEAFAASDAAALGDALATLGLLDPQHAATALAVAEHVLGELGGAAPSRLDTPALIAARERLEDRPEEVVELVLSGALPPQELWPARGIGMLFGTIARVGATGAWRELLVRALRDGWSATPLDAAA